MNYKQKIKQADQILKKLKQELLEIIMDTQPQQYCSNKLLLPWLEEDTEYEIKKLKLGIKDEQRYIRKIHNIFGTYAEDIPLLKRNRFVKKKRKSQ